MTNLDIEFKQFNDTIKLTEARKEKILNSRNAIREKIRTYMKNKLKLEQPKFMWQGSFAINTALNPINGNEVDIDDGMYLNHLSKIDERLWPSPKEVHNMILAALEGHTQNGCEDKTSCVRVIYNNFYHVDIPVYIIREGHAKLANIKTNKWEISDSKDFRDWFYKYRKDEQANRIVRYLKAWRDFNVYDFSSIELTILVVNNYVQDADDGQSLSATVEKIYSDICMNRKVVKPVAPRENLWCEKTNKIDTLIFNFEQLKKDLKSACTNKSKNRATLILQEQFGDRFPVITDKCQEDTNEYSWSPKPWRM